MKRGINLFILIFILTSPITFAQSFGHPSNQIFPGSFPVGDYVFSGNLNITNVLYLGGGAIQFNVSSGNYMFSNGSEWKAFGSSIPYGAIVPFHLASCPSGWNLADGSGGTPDLRGIFVRGSGTSDVLSDANDNPFNATQNTYYNDSFQGHWHKSLQVGNVAPNYAGGVTTVDGGGNDGQMQTGRDPVTDTTNGDPRTGSETAPASWATIYCMKITTDTATSNSLWQKSGDEISLTNSSQNLVVIGNITGEGLGGYDSEGGFRYAKINGNKTKIYTKYFTGTMDGDSQTDVAHGIVNGGTKIISADVTVWNRLYGDSGNFRIAFDNTNIEIFSVAVAFQSQLYRIKIDYYI